MQEFDPGAGDPPSAEAGIFGLSGHSDSAEIHLVSVSWDATTSYGHGASATPESIIAPSHQLDLQDPLFGPVYKHGIFLHKPAADQSSLNLKARAAADELRAYETPPQRKRELCDQVNAASEQINRQTYEQVAHLLQQGRKVGLLGGDHSCPFGMFKALAEVYPGFGILHIDAHLDLRQAYEGFQYSHASIMRNALDQLAIGRLVSVGVRDYCRSEINFVREHSSLATVFEDCTLFDWKSSGRSWQSICDEILAQLPERVLVSFDIDGLDPALCPSTGTPVPGGLSFNEASYLLYRLAGSGKKVIGFDLCELVPGPTDWDLNVGARVLYRLCGLLASASA